MKPTGSDLKFANWFEGPGMPCSRISNWFSEPFARRSAYSNAFTGVFVSLICFSGPRHMTCLRQTDPK